jgi:hypothetical protein
MHTQKDHQQQEKQHEKVELGRENHRLFLQPFLYQQE